MMPGLAVLALALAASVVPEADAQSMESWRSGADAAFADALRGAALPAPPAPARAAPVMIGAFEEKEKSRVAKLELRALAPRTALGPALARMSLPESLDALRRAGPISIDGRDWNVGLAADAEFKYFFLTFTEGGATRLDPLGRPKDLLHQGIVLELPGGGAYRCTIDLRLLSPVRGSTIEFESVSGGPPMTLSTGRLFDSLKAKATAFKLGETQYYVAYLSDIDPATSAPVGTRSFLIYEERRFLPKAWRLPAADLPEGVPVSVTLDGADLALRKDASGLLSLYSR